MAQSYTGTTNKLLGYPDDARLLIINADDFGMCHATNAAIFQALTYGIVTSTTLMVPCPWALQAMHWLQGNPDIVFGVHLTVVSEWVDYRWGPLTPHERVSSLVDEAGYFYNFERIHALLAEVSLKELEVEFRAQIEVVMAANLKPTHLDWHALRIAGRGDIFDLMTGLAREYGLALRVYGRPWIERVHTLGLPANDYDFLDSYGLDTEAKSACYTRMLRELPEGLSEWAVHPGIANAELQAIEPGSSRIRQTDLDYFISSEAGEIIRREGIVLLNYRPLQAVWQSVSG